MFLDQLDTAGSLPALATTMRFAAQRQRILAHNIANLETPSFTPADVDPSHFQRALGEAIHERRLSRSNGTSGAFEVGRTRQLEVGPGGRLTLTPRTATGNVMFHDRNNRDLERSMQALAENAGMFRTAADLMRNRATVLHWAINERSS
jgi:flagellar basal-body rod protein FlgB